MFTLIAGPELRSLVYVILCLMGFVDTPSYASKDCWKSLGWICKNSELIGPEEYFDPEDESITFRDAILWAKDWMDLISNAPSIKSIKSFPSQRTALNNCELSYKYLCFLRLHYNFSHFKDEVKNVVQKTEKLSEVWSLIADVQNELPVITKVPHYTGLGYADRRLKLKTIRNIIGQQAFDQRNFPNPIPLEYLKEIN